MMTCCWWRELAHWEMTSEESAGFEGDEDIAEDIVGRHAIGQMEKGAQPEPLGAGKKGKLGEVAAVRQHGAEGDDQNIGQREANLARHAAIVEGGEASLQIREGGEVGLGGIKFGI